MASDEEVPPPFELEHVIGLSCVTADAVQPFALDPADKNRAVWALGTSVAVNLLDDSHEQVLLTSHRHAVTTVAMASTGTIASGQVYECM
ncbi:hypothetical protein KIPB_013728 [Kipferlia bialata]|uniref:Uncharacterized protein n=1 Tax=Kipferlia bialata TaxID=797122 RepID=A0A9K3GQC2_9EUKA|nr:hypothetical protein KIPB_013728 [Kipferlia bialata]|eukprot:g13728.t1